MTIVAVGLQIYDLTGSTLAVSLVALFALVPMIVFGLYGGVLADAFDRRARRTRHGDRRLGVDGRASRLFAWLDVRVVWPLYVLTTINAVASVVIGATRQAITPRLLPARLLPAASALGGISMGVMVTVGPALAGVLVATVGITWTYTVDVVLFTAAFLGIFTLPRIVPEGERQSAGTRVRAASGCGSCGRRPNLRMTFVLDIIAMTFGQPRALFPAVGALLIGGGPVTVGILTAAGAVGNARVERLLRPARPRALAGPRGRAGDHGYGACILGFGIVLAVVAFGGTAASAGTASGRTSPTRTCPL